MTPAPRLIELVRGLREARIPHLIMGGHAVRHYGVDRNTLDFDFHVSGECRETLLSAIRSVGLFSAAPVVEGPSWRPQQFRRFLIGRLPDGREEWFEFWFGNHLLRPFGDLLRDCEETHHEGLTLCYLGLGDLLRSKETERESDWQDIALLEEIFDARSFSHGNEDESAIHALANLRSRKGFDRLHQAGLLANHPRLQSALHTASHPVTQAFLGPFAGDTFAPLPGPWAELLAGPLRQATPGSARHFALVEAIRRLYKQACMDRDRRDKNQHLDISAQRS